MDYTKSITSRNQQIELQELKGSGVELWLKREDEIHPEISGNKWRKLKYHIQFAMDKKSKGLITYGGAFSNHIAATAAACRAVSIESVGVIRGERVEPLNNTLSRALEHGMRLHFVTRSDYRDSKPSIANVLDPEGLFHVVPEGGADAMGVKGCTEILTKEDLGRFDQFVCSSGTGATAAGILSVISKGNKLRVYPALKGDFMRGEIEKLCPKQFDPESLEVSHEYHLGGYSKTNAQLFDFIRNVYRQVDIRLDPIYTGKMLFGLVSDIKNGKFPAGSRILAIHTGGLQGIPGIEQRDGVELFPSER